MRVVLAHLFVELTDPFTGFA